MWNKLNLTGKKFGLLTVLEPAENKGKQTNWLCECDCGNKKSIATTNLRRGDTKSCGCSQSKLSSEKKLSNLIGRQFGPLKSN